MPLADRRATPLAFVDNLETVVLSDGDAHHFRASLRLGAGALIVVSDGAGRYRFARLGPRSEGSSAGSNLTIESEILTEPEPATPIAIGFAPVKAQKPEWMVQKLTELGVDIIQPLMTERSVVRWDKKKRVALEARMAVAAREASMQSRRVWLPTIEEPRGIAQAITHFAALGRETVLADPAGSGISDPSALILIGPEGGWSASESEMADHVRLPGNVLRAETAVITAGSVLSGLRSGLFR